MLITPWTTDAEFLEAVQGCDTLLDPVRLYILWQCARISLRAQGDFAEVGVYRGGSALLMARAIRGARPLHLFDTFAGLPPHHPLHDIERPAGIFSDVDLGALLKMFSPYQAAFHVGNLQDTAHKLHRDFAFVHVDADLYRSVACSCQVFWPLLSPGGVMLFDDYGWTSCPGAKRAVDEYFERSFTLSLPTGQLLVWK